MPKLKTSRTAAKRFTFTKTGKVKRKRAYTRHHAWAKSPKQKRHLRASATLNKADTKLAHALMPYA
jgi:large subunit ribosomal protein L35